MRLQSLSLEQFRSYKEAELDFSGADVHLFVGSNGAGKTNILEAISLLSMTRSFLGCEEADLLQWSTEFYRVRCTAMDDAGEGRMLEVVSQIVPRVQKACFLNDVRISAERMIGVMPTVVFLPQDLQLFTGAPALRRRFMDRLLCQVSPEYLHCFTQFQKVLKQRNTLLKRIASGSSSAEDLDVWDEHLVQCGAPLTLARLELCGTLQLTLPEEMIALGGRFDDVRLSYERQGIANGEGPLRLEYRERLAASRSRDLMLQSTTVGPHREDWRLLVDGRDVAVFASRGEQRMSLIALLLLQVSYLELRCGERPIILLDDVFSELDDAHQQSLLCSLEGYQVLLTAVRVPEGPCVGHLWNVAPGAIAATQTSVVRGSTAP